MTENGKDRIGDYGLMDLIGDGAQGRVYKAQYLGDDETKVAKGEVVAIKLIRITGDDDKLRTKFQAQADILRRLSHSNIVSYRDSFSWHAGEWDEAQCLVMEFLDGEPLSDRMKQAGSGLPWTQVEEVFEQCLAALIHARERGITHRDIKPSNLFITREGISKVIDFDIARRDDSGQISTAGWKGTFDYMAPDFITIDGFRGDEISDIFSLGVCFYQALTGSLPYEPLGESAHIGYLNRWRAGAAPSPSFRPGVFRVLSNAKPFIAKCLASRREHRYQTFAAMLEDFRKIRARRIRHKNKDEYELLAVLGRGGFGEVFKARRISDGSLVAVKHLFAEKQSDRFIKEAKILQQYPHPNLCKYVDFMVVEGTAGEKQYFLILEYLEGMPGWTLRTRLKNEGSLEAAEAMPLFIGYLSALQFLHENSRPIIHRDIKPGNLYAPVGQPDKGKVFDLGVARDVSGTVTVGGVPGTLDYMPPEFAEAGGDRGSPQSDLYALGLCLYESVAGKPVYERLPTDLNSAWVAFQQRLRKPLELTFTADAFRQYPRLKSIILKSLAARPVDRYSSAAGMKRDLEAVLSGQGGGEAEPSDEVTMATLHSFADDDELRAPEPGATVGTRALDGMGGTLPAPMGLLAAGRAESERRRRKKRMTLIAAAAAVVLVLLVSLIIGTVTGRHSITAAQNMNQAREAVEQVAGELRVPVPTADYARTLSEAYAAAVKTGQQYPEISGRIDEQRQQMRRSGAALPAEFKRSFEVALKADKADKAEGLLKEWQGLSAYADILGLTAKQHAERSQAMKSALLRFPVEHELASLRLEIPSGIQTGDELDKGEAAAAHLKTLRDRAWPGFDEVEKQQQLATLASTLSDRTQPAIARLRDAALVLYREGQNGDAEREALLKFAESHPSLAWIAQAAYLDARNSVEAARQSRMLSGGMSKVLENAANARDEHGMTTVTAELAALENTPGLRTTPGQIKAAEEAIGAKYLVFAGEHARKAREAFNAARMAEGQKAQKALAELVEMVPERFGKAALETLARDVEAQRAGAQARQDQATVSQRKIRQDALVALADVRALLRKGDIRASVAGVPALAAIPASLQGDKEFKADYEAAVAEYARLVESAVAQKDPLDQRAQRLQAADEILNAASAETVFAGRIKALRDQLAVQKAVMIIRFINRAGQPVRVSGEDLKDRLTLAAEAVKEVELKARSTNSPLSFLVEGEAGSKPRIESVALAGAGGREVLLTKLDKEQEPVKEPAAKVSGGREQAPATLPPARKTASEGRGVLDIMVSPKTATLMVDGNVVPAGRIEVSPDVNHKVQVEAPGYKVCLQYYRVRAGETRKIDILLEKAPKKSLFGL